MANRHESVEVRVARQVQIGGPDECWPWTGTKSAKGYGIISVDNHHRQAHRIVYELERGPLPDDLTIDHLCRNRVCCNPAHMEPVTGRENTLRGFGPAGLAARRTHCPKGHPYDATRGTERHRYCLTCNRERNRRYYEANIERERARKRGAA